MGVAYNPRIVTDNLVLCLDAANPRSYPGSGTSWIDLSGNGNNGTLVNGVGYTNADLGSLTFDGSNDYVTPSGLSDSFFQGNFTASFWVNMDTLSVSPSGSDDKTILQHGSSTTNSGMHLVQRNQTFHFGLFANDISGTTTLSIGTWYNVVFVLNNSTFYKAIYLNGNLDASHTGIGAYGGTGGNARIGGVVLSFGLYFDGYISNCCFYNRVISQNEINQNFNAIKSRYGL